MKPERLQPKKMKPERLELERLEPKRLKETRARDSGPRETGARETEVSEKGRPEGGGCLPEACQGSTGLSLSATPYIVDETCYWPGQAGQAGQGRLGESLARAGLQGRAGRRRKGGVGTGQLGDRPCGRRVGPFPSRGPAKAQWN